MKNNYLKSVSWYIIIIVLFFALSGIASAKTYYVDPTNGNNANVGTSTTSAFKDLEYAFGKLAGGDTLYLMNGKYFGPFVLRSKSFSSNVTIAGYENNGAVITSYLKPYASTPNTLWTKRSVNSKNSWVTKLSSTSVPNPRIYYSDNVKFFTWNTFTDFKNSDYPESTWYNSSSKELWVMFKDSTKNPNNIGLYISTADFALRVESNTLSEGAYIIFSNLNFKYNAYNFNILKQSNAVVQKSNFYGGHFGLSIDGGSQSSVNNVIIRDNFFDGAQNSVWYQQDMKDSRTEETTGVWGQYFKGRVYVYKNTFSNWHGGVTLESWSPTDFKGSEVAYNTFRKGRGSQMEIEEYCHTSSWHHNTVIDSEFAGVSWAPADASASPTPCEFYNNVIILKGSIRQNPSTTYKSYAIKIDKNDLGMKNWVVHHNTFYGYGRALDGVSDNSVTSGVTFRDNIFFADQEYILTRTGNLNNNIMYDYNLYYSPSGGYPPFVRYGNDADATLYNSLSEILSSGANGGKWDKHSKEANPLFADISKNDATPTTGSPACTMSSTGGYVGALPCKGGTTPTPYCGDKSCNNGETCSSCAGDCGACQSNTITSCTLQDKTWQEDNSLSNAINLGSCFSDPLGQKLTYKVSGNKSIIVSIDSTGMVDLSSPKNFFGLNDVYFTATAGDGRTAKTNTIKLTVTPVVECGDYVCEEGETCNSCSADCGQCSQTDITACTLSGKSWSEDTTLSNAYVLKDCFYDPLGQSLKFGVQGLRSIRVNMKTDSSVELSAPADWFGSEEIYFTATAGNRTARTNAITLTVLPQADCGDNFCDSSESCNSCADDCGECPVDIGESEPEPEKKSGGGGGGSSKSSFITLPKEEPPVQNLTIIDTAETEEDIYQTGEEETYDVLPKAKTEDIVEEKSNILTETRDTISDIGNGITGFVTSNVNSFQDAQKKGFSWGTILIFLVIGGMIYLVKGYGLPQISLMQGQKADAQTIEMWKDYLADYESKGFTLKEIRGNLVSNGGYDASFVDLVLKVYVDEKIKLIDEPTKKEWFKYFGQCQKSGLSMQQVKDYLLTEQGENKVLIEALIQEYMKRAG